MINASEIDFEKNYFVKNFDQVQKVVYYDPIKIIRFAKMEGMLVAVVPVPKSNDSIAFRLEDIYNTLEEAYASEDNFEVEQPSAEVVEAPVAQPIAQPAAQQVVMETMKK